MRTIRVFVGLSLAVAAWPSGIRGEVCSKAGFAGTTQAANQAHMIGVAQNDTMFAGPGSVQYRSGPGHFGPAATGKVFGQVIAIEKIAGKAAAGLPAEVRHVVLVPWDYDPSCAPVPWTRDARWVAPGTRALFTAQLRERKEWAYGLPTFDVLSPDLEPYPQRLPRMTRETDAALTIDELFPVMSLFPDRDELRRDGRRAVQPLLDWARANPELVTRYPVNQALQQAYFAQHRYKLNSIASALVGTYELTISLGDGPARTFYARTRAVPTTEWPQKLERPADLTSEPPRPDGYYLLMAAALKPAELPVACNAPQHQGYFAVTDPAGAPDPAVREWQGNIELAVLERLFPADAELRQFARDEFKRFGARAQAKLPPAAHARFTRASDGTVRVEQTITFEDGRTLNIRGTRTSRVVLDCQY